MQARTQQLLQQNRELLDHIASLNGLNESERPGISSANIGMTPQVDFFFFFRYGFRCFCSMFMFRYFIVCQILK